MKFENKFYKDYVYNDLDDIGYEKEDKDLYTYDKVSRMIINEIKTYYEYNEELILEHIKHLSCSKSSKCIGFRFIYLKFQFDWPWRKTTKFFENVQTYFWKLKRFELFNPSKNAFDFHDEFDFENLYKFVSLKIKYDSFFKRFFLFLHYYKSENDYKKKNVETVLVSSHYDYDVLYENLEKLKKWISTKKYKEHSYINYSTDDDQWYIDKNAIEQWYSSLDKNPNIDKTTHYCMAIDTYNRENCLHQYLYPHDGESGFGIEYLDDEYSYNEPDEKFFTSFNDDESDQIERKNKDGILLDDIAGLESVKKAFQEKVILPITHKKYYEKFNKKTGGGILLYGLPGTGKTMFAEAVSNEIDAKFISLKCSDIKSKWSGESEQNIKKTFDEARKHNRSIIFFDEFEAIGRKRSSSEEYSEANNIVPEILAQIQGVNTNTNNILIIAATNRPWDIDSALLRPGRFDTKIYIDLPDYESRKKIFEIKLKNIPSKELDLNYLAEVTDGCNGADVAEFVERLKMEAIHRSINNKKTSPINKDDVNNVLKTFESSVMIEDIEKLKKFKFN